LLGERNWWAPAPLRRFHDRYGTHEAASVAVAPAAPGGASPAPTGPPAVDDGELVPR
jgi:RND superfamily putative drug exporter